jgi:hypothetical protein
MEIGMRFGANGEFVEVEHNADDATITSSHELSIVTVFRNRRFACLRDRLLA